MVALPRFPAAPIKMLSRSVVGASAAPISQENGGNEPRRLSLRRNFLWTLAGNVVYAGCQWGILVVLAKLGTPEMVGQFALGLAITAPIFMFSSLQLRSVQATDTQGEYHFGDYLALRLLGVLLSLLVVGGVAGFSSYRWDTKLVLLAVGLAKAFESISDVFYGLFQQQERLDYIAISMIVKGPLSLLALGLVLYWTGSVLGGTLALGGAWALILVAIDVYRGEQILAAGATLAGSQAPLRRGCRQVWRLPWKPAALRRLAWLTLPLGFAMMLVSLNHNLPRYCIEHFLGERELGIFSAMAYIMVSGAMVVLALGQSASHKLAKYFHGGNRRAFCSLFGKLIGCALCCGLLGIILAAVAGREILLLLYSYEYAARTEVFFLLMVAAAALYLVSSLNLALIALKYFRLQLLLLMLTSLTILLLSFTLIPGQGLSGAAWALISGFGIHASIASIIVLYNISKLGQNPQHS